MGKDVWKISGDTARGGWMSLVIVLALILFSARPAQGQLIKGEIVSVGIGGREDTQGLYRAGSWVPVLVNLKNRSGKVFAGRLAIEEKDLDGDRVLSVGSKFFLQPTDVDGRLLWTYYWPRPDDFELSGIKSVVVMDETGSQGVATISTPDGRTNAVGIGKSDMETMRSQRFVLILGGKLMGWQSFFKAWGGTEGVRTAWVSNPSQLPDDVKGFDGVDVIVWQADTVKVSDISPEFQLKAMLQWVKAGGHLVISVGTQGQEFLKAGSALGEAMPLTISGTRQLSLQAMGNFPGCTAFNPVPARGGQPAWPGNTTPFVQAIGTLKPGARTVSGAASGVFAEQPLVVTGPYGRGAITVLTMDAGSPEMEARFIDHNWIEFWSAVAGWRPGEILTEAETKARKDDPVTAAREIRLGDAIPQLIDVSDVTAIRIVVAVLFLAVYWLLAGPLGHLVMRYYRVVHWSWWIFGASVVLATGVAGVVVYVLHIANYDLRHKSFVLGAVNSREVSVVGFYGVYAPTSGGVELKLPEGTGMNYLAPLCLPTIEAVKPYADPQGYEADAENAWAIAPVFRNTLKKMQGRWTGERDGIVGTSAYTNDPEKPLTGELINYSGYDLENVRIIVYRASESRPNGTSYLFDYKSGTWKNGETLDLGKSIERNKMLGALTVERMLQVVGWKYAAESMISGGIGAGVGFEMGDAAALYGSPVSDDLLYLLLDERIPDKLKSTNDNVHYEPIRSIERLTDCTKMLHAAGVLIVANAGNIKGAHYVPNPVALTVDGKPVTGKGEILFAYALQPNGKPPMAGAVAEQPAPLGVEPKAPVRGGAAGNSRGAERGIAPTVENP